MSVVTGQGPVNVGGLTDDELVQLAREGHESAFNTIVHRYRAPLVSYCRRWLDPHRSEEVVQHTLMKAFLSLRDDDRPLVLRPWLYRVAHNAALNALEKKGSDWDELDENYDGVPQPPQVAEQRARFLKVVHEIEALPDRQREALLLNEFEGRCYADIAAELGTSESGVRGLLRRARRQLRETAAALFLPFPAVRELLRSDASRSFQTERAGEIIGTAGTAGAAGGLSAAGGGLAKVAAGVLAAGTIAGGGTALERARPIWKAPEAQAQGVATHAGEDGVTHVARRVVASAGAERQPVTSRRVSYNGGAALPEDGAWDEAVHNGASFHGSEGELRSHEQAPTGDEPEAVPDPEAPAGTPVELPDPDVEAPDDGNDVPVDVEDPDEDSADDDGDEPDGQPGGDGGGDGGRNGEPTSVPATQSPTPLRG